MNRAELNPSELAKQRGTARESEEPIPEVATTRRQWRSLEELSDSPDFRAFLENELPTPVAISPDAVGRREFLRLMAASLALAGTAGCTRQPEERIYPYVKAPEQIVPGEPLFFATAMPMAGSRAAPLS